MKITPIKFQGVRAPKDAQDIKSRPGLSYSSALELPKTIYLFDQYLDYISLGKYAQILPGGWHSEQSKILDSIDEYTGPILLPFGEPMTLVTCGTWVKMFLHEDNRIIIDFNVKDTRKRTRFMFQVHFLLDEPNIVEYHYYHVQTGYRTLIGAKAKNGEWIEWPDMEADYPYFKVGLRLDCSLDMPEEEDDKPEEIKVTPTRDVSKRPDTPARPGYEWRKYNTPMGDVWKEVKLPEGDSWGTVWSDGRYRLQILT